MRNLLLLIRGADPDDSDLLDILLPYTEGIRDH